MTPEQTAEHLAGDESIAEDRAAERRGDYLSPRDREWGARKASDAYEAGLERDLRRVKRCGCGCAS